MENKNRITIFTDGSSLGNPGRGGWGAIVVRDERVTELGGSEDHTTNNRMELSAAIGALSVVSDIDSPIILHTDSSYCINGITKWVYGWMKNNWISSTKTEVMNRDLFEKLLSVSRGKMIEWKYVGGHIGILGNERADAIAVSFAEGKAQKLFDGKLSDYSVSNILDISYDEKEKKDRSAGRAHSKAKAFSYVSMVDGVIQTHATWAECEKQVKGKNAKFKKSVSKDDERNIIAEWKK